VSRAVIVGGGSGIIQLGAASLAHRAVLLLGEAH
jgi:predicted ATPase with chaperone activity